MGPQYQSLLQQVQGPLHYLLLVLVAAVVQGNLDEEVQTDLGSPVSVRLLVDLVDRLLLLFKAGLLSKLQLSLLKLPLNIDKGHVGGYFLDQRVARSRVVGHHQPLHRVDHLRLEFVLFELVENAVVLYHDFPEPHESVGLAGLLVDSLQRPLDPVAIDTQWLVVPVGNQYVQGLLYEGPNLEISLAEALQPSDECQVEP